MDLVPRTLHHRADLQLKIFTLSVIKPKEEAGMASMTTD